MNEISFSYEKMGTKTRFEEEAKGNSEMAYSVIMVHKCRINQAPPYLCNLFHDRFSVSGRSTRNESQLNFPKCRLSTGQRSFAFRGAKEYNLLPECIRATNNFSAKRKAAVHIFENIP